MNAPEIKDLFIEHVNLISDFSSELIGNLDPEDLDTTHLIDVGINSIEYAYIASCLMEKLNIYQPLDVFLAATTIGECLELLYFLQFENNTKRDLAEPIPKY